VLRRLLVVGLAGGCLAVPTAGGGVRAIRAAPFLVPGQMRLVSYYPAHNGWTYMWQRWDPRAIDRDFGLIAGLHANTVRIFVQPSVFGYPRPTARARAELATVFALAAKHHLAVELTLFDWWFGYTDVTGSEEWAHSLLSRYAGDPRLACVELRNEIDPGDQNAVAWARTMLPYLRTVVPGTPVTLSVSANDPVTKLTELSSGLAPVAPDFWSFHYYDKAEYAYWAIAAARAAVAPVPLVVGETGYQPGASVPQPRTQADLDEEQARYLRTVMNATALLGLPPAGVWVLLNFTRAASPVRLPADEYDFGLFQADRRPKPAAAIVRAAFASPGRTAPYFDGDFEQQGLGTWRPHGAGAIWRATGDEHGGAGAAEIAGTGPGRGALTTIPTMPWVTPGQVLMLSAWVSGTAATGTTRVAIRWFAGDRTPLGETDSEPLPDGTTGWTQLTAAGPAPPGAAFVAVALTSTGNTGAVRFDDVSLGGG
jgi:hypothetical protein